MLAKLNNPPTRQDADDQLSKLMADSTVANEGLKRLRKLVIALMTNSQEFKDALRQAQLANSATKKAADKKAREAAAAAGAAPTVSSTSSSNDGTGSPQVIPKSAGEATSSPSDPPDMLVAKLLTSTKKIGTPEYSKALLENIEKVMRGGLASLGEEVQRASGVHAAKGGAAKEASALEGGSTGLRPSGREPTSSGGWWIDRRGDGADSAPFDWAGVLEGPGGESTFTSPSFGDDDGAPTPPAGRGRYSSESSPASDSIGPAMEQSSAEGDDSSKNHPPPRWTAPSRGRWSPRPAMIPRSISLVPPGA